MKKYNASEFESGDEVFHSTDSRRKLVVSGVNLESNQVTCRWMDTAGKLSKETFDAPELKKWSDKPPSFIYTF